MKKLSFTAVAVIALLISACHTTDPNPTISEHKIVTYTALHNTRFILQTVNGCAITGIHAEKQPHIAFDGQNRLSGVMCNNFFGPYALDNNILKAEVASTRMLCPKEDVGNAEQSLFKLLNDGAQVQLTTETLTLRNDKSVFVFQRL